MFQVRASTFSSCNGRTTVAMKSGVTVGGDGCIDQQCGTVNPPPTPARLVRLLLRRARKQMLRFMLQEGVAEILISFITLVGAEGERPVRGSAESEDLKKSYR
jgi:hypothetical protein